MRGGLSTLNRPLPRPASPSPPPLPPSPSFPADGNRVKIPMGDGSKESKPFKCEWSCQIGEYMYVGSTGKERTDDDGYVVHEGEMWVKRVDKDWKIEHVDWRRQYNSLRAATKSGQGQGYHVHEAGRWSDVHNRWFFFPRKLSRETYDEKGEASERGSEGVREGGSNPPPSHLPPSSPADEQKCCNLFMSADQVSSHPELKISMDEDVSRRPGSEPSESQLARVYSACTHYDPSRCPFSDFRLAHLTRIST